MASDQEGQKPAEARVDKPAATAHQAPLDKSSAVIPTSTVHVSQSIAAHKPVDSVHVAPKTAALVQVAAVVPAASVAQPTAPHSAPVPAEAAVPAPPAQSHPDSMSSAKPPVSVNTTPSSAPKPSLPQVSFELPSAVYSPQLLESVIYDIQIYLDWYRQNQIRKQVGAKPKAEPNHSDETVLVIEAWLQGKPATLDSMADLIDYLKKLDLPEVHVMLAALPNRSQRQALVDWFRNNTTQHLLLSFVADRNLGGGVVVRTPNRVFDFAWKQQLVAGRDKLAGILKSV